MCATRELFIGIKKFNTVNRPIRAEIDIHFITDPYRFDLTLGLAQTDVSDILIRVVSDLNISDSSEVFGDNRYDNLVSALACGVDLDLFGPKIPTAPRLVTREVAPESHPPIFFRKRLSLFNRRDYFRLRRAPLDQPVTGMWVEPNLQALSLQYRSRQRSILT